MMQQIEIYTCRIPYIVSYAYTHIHTYTSRPTSHPYLYTYITFRGEYSLLPPPLSRPVPPHPLLPSLYGRQQRIVSCRCPLFSMGGHVCVRAWLSGGMYVCTQKEEVAAFSLSLSSSFSSLDRPRRCFQIYHLMDLSAGDALRVSFCRLDLTLLCSGQKGGRSLQTLSLKRHLRLFRIHTLLISAKAHAVYVL